MIRPAMSVILVTPDRYETIARTVASLRAQSAAAQLELIVVSSEGNSLDVPETECNLFAAVRLVASPVKRLAAAHAAGVRAATAPVIAFAEDHAFPTPGWAKALIAAHRGPWTAVGPAMRNANPATSTSRADFLLGYGRWREPIRAGETNHIPGHNSSYKRSALMIYGGDLEEYLQAPALLHQSLASRGHHLYLEPAAVVAHTNFSSVTQWLHVRFHAGRVFATARGRAWSLQRRLLYILAAPLIPFVRLARIAKESRRDRQPAGFFLKVAPLLWCGLMLDALGELTGYAAPVSGAYEREWEWEFHREPQP
jgi:hypothetical protein